MSNIVQLTQIRDQIINFGKQIMVRRTGALAAGVDELVYETLRPCILSFTWSTNSFSGQVRTKPGSGGAFNTPFGQILKDGSGTFAANPSSLRNHPSDVYEVLEREVTTGFVAIMYERVFAEGVSISCQNNHTLDTINLACRIEGRSF